MKLAPLFHNYEILVDKAEAGFIRMKNDYGQCILCELHCSDCCHAVFGLFLIEAVYIREQFAQIREDLKEDVIERSKKFDREIADLHKKLKAFEDDPRMQNYTMARERIRCPMLDDREECVIYHRRPITCRIYGIPTRIHGKIRACGKSGFKEGETYPVFDLDGIYRDLFILSKDLLDAAGVDSTDKATLMISMSKIIQTPIDDLINNDF